MTKIKTFAQACKKLKLKASNLPVVDMLPKKHQKAIIAHYKLVIITQAMNDGWEPDWNDYGQYKYFPWFKVTASETIPAGFGFSASYYDHSSTRTRLGSRLCFKSSELALEAGKQFEKLYIDYFLIR